MKRLVIFSLMLPLAGCALWKDFKHPDTPQPENWNTPPARDALLVWPDTDWWESFHSPALTAQIEEAHKANFDLAAAVAQVREADAQTRIAGAALLPSVNASAGANRDRSAGTFGKAHVANTYNAGLSATYEIDFWGKNYAAEQAAKALADASRFDRETVALTVTSSVASTYFDIIATQERLALARDNLDAAQQLLDAFHKRFKQGVSTALDVAQQESVVATQRAAIPPLELHLRQDLDAQAILLGRLPENMETPYALSGAKLSYPSSSPSEGGENEGTGCNASLSRVPNLASLLQGEEPAGFCVKPYTPEKLADMALPEVGAGLPSELLQRRPDVQSAEAQLASAHANIIVARAAFFPSISLTGSGGYDSAEFAQLFRPDSVLWSLGSSLAQPIFEGGLLTGQLDLAKARRDELLQDYRKAVISAFSDTEDALAAVRQDAAEEDAERLAVDAAQNAYQLTEQQLGGGIIDITTVLNTQRTLFSARDAYLQARLAHLQAIVGLYKALGGGWKKDDIMMNNKKMK